MILCCSHLTCAILNSRAVLVNQADRWNVRLWCCWDVYTAQARTGSSGCRRWLVSCSRTRPSAALGFPIQLVKFLTFWKPYYFAVLPCTRSLRCLSGLPHKSQVTGLSSRNVQSNSHLFIRNGLSSETQHGLTQSSGTDGVTWVKSPNRSVSVSGQQFSEVAVSRYQAINDFQYNLNLA